MPEIRSGLCDLGARASCPRGRAEGETPSLPDSFAEGLFRQSLSTTVVVIPMGGAAPSLPRFWPRPRSSAIVVTANGWSDREGNAMAAHSIHIRSASDAQLPRGSPADHGCGVGHCASRGVKKAVRGTRVPRQGQLVHAQPAQRTLAARVLMGQQARACARRGGDSDGGRRQLDAVGATSTNPAPPRRCAQPARSTARTGAGFRHSSRETQPLSGFERAQTARTDRNQPPLFWCHWHPTFRSHDAQEGLCPHRQPSWREAQTVKLVCNMPKRQSWVEPCFGHGSTQL